MEEEKIEEQIEKEIEEKYFKRGLEWYLCLLIALIMALLTRYYIGTATIIRHDSMAPTLRDKQKVITSRINRITKNEYEVGDIIVFEAPSELKEPDTDIFEGEAIYNNEPKGLINKFVYYVLEFNKVSYIKRIIAVEGDYVRIMGNKVYVNGKLLEENYLPEGTETKGVYCNNIVVPKGHVYVLGDNRGESLDSRAFGCIPIEKIEGKVVFCYWPLSKFGGI